MQGFEQIYLRTLRHLYDAENQLVATLGALSTSNLDPALTSVISDIEEQSRTQATRLEEIFHLLYKEPTSQAAWVATALLREAWEASCNECQCGATEACAAALLALKRYELTLYESLLRWSERYDFHEALPSLRRAIAEELVQASILAGFAFKVEAFDAGKVIAFPPAAVH